MSSTIAPAPVAEPCKNEPKEFRLPPTRTSLRFAALVALLILVLSGCGSQQPPYIQPSEDGNFILQVSPEDAEVTVVQEGFESTSIAASKGTMAQGELRYALKPGRYLVRVTRPGYMTVERLVEIPVPDSTGENGEVPQEFNEKIVLEPESTPDSGGTTPEEPADGEEEAGSGGELPQEPDGGEDSVVAPRGFALRGDPNFTVSSLNSEQRLWYERLWAAIENPDASPNPDKVAASDDLYEYGRQLHTHIQTLLMVFRVTGDLRLLDEVDRLAQIMRSKLRDEWRDTLDGTDGTKDGYLNWVYRYGSDSQFEGKDNHATNEVKTHTLVAEIAYALDNNRDLISPSGRKYGEHADFWRDYLQNHFEPKWRKRKDKPTGYPIIMRPHAHTYLSGLKYHYFMYKLVGNQEYLDEANRRADIIWNQEMKLIDAPGGKVYVWARSVLSEGGSGNYLHPTTYSRNIFADAVELHFEGYGPWANEVELTRLARTITEFVFDKTGAVDGDDWFARDIGGGVSRAGIPSDSSWQRIDVSRYALSPFSLIASWDGTGAINGMSKEVLTKLGETNQAKAVYLVAGIFVDSMLP